MTASTSSTSPGRARPVRWAPADRAARPRVLPLPEGWPLLALLGLYPLWWAIGMGEFIWPVLALPMAASLLRQGRIRVPPFFWLWLLLLTWMLVSSVSLGVQVPGTVPASFVHRLPAYILRFAQYAAATVTLLYVGNLTEAQLSRERLIRLLGIFFLYALAGGLAGLVWPQVNFTTPVESLLTRAFAHGGFNAGFIRDLAHPHTADVQQVLGYTTPRPSAPFPYTNTWGYVISILALWFVLWLWPAGSRRARAAVVVAGCLFTVAVVASLNRGVWIGVVGVVAYLGLRMLSPRRAGAVVALAAALVVAVLATPLGHTVQLRLSHPHSNAGREQQGTAALQRALGSPIVGYGSTRTLVGNTNSIAAAPTPECPDCGGIAIGSAGELWLVVFAQGFVGAGLFLSYLVATLWVYRRDRSSIGVAGRLTIVLSLFYVLFYDAAGVPLAVTLLAIALLWRNQETPTRPTTRVIANRSTPRHSSVAEG